LSIETSQKVSSAALHSNGKLLIEQSLYNEKAASGMLAPMIEQLLSNFQIKPSDLEAIAVAKGPGSYTGLRIAVSTAKGLCMAIDKPLIAIETLKAMATQVVGFFPKNILFCPMLDARRMEVYTEIYDADLNIIEAVSAKIIEEYSFSELLANKSVVFFGDGAEKCRAILQKNANAIFLNKEIFPSADTVGVLAYDKFIKKDFENLVTFEPYYLKEFVGTIAK
jgi:tRNA threonylcarbamoyladenosine biosynthesis protein TsaB